ncbi:MAG TPA: hypothetical protein VFR81_02705 [Longimicrobium sp.]|nr:hypothetical protein [Longimicrobium sp.]
MLASSDYVQSIPPLERLRVWFYSFYKPAIAAGTRAEWHFAALAREKRWVLERVNQSREGMAQYRAVAERSVKRGDFICRNCNNAEIELKCKTMYRGDGCYYIEYSEIKRLEAMQQITGAPVVFALMEREGSGVRPGSLRMFKLDFLLRTHDYHDLYDRSTKCVRVPLKYTRPGFEVLRMMGGTGDG